MDVLGRNTLDCVMISLHITHCGSRSTKLLMSAYHPDAHETTWPLIVQHLSSVLSNATYIQVIHTHLACISGQLC